jgi:uncharacterized repeat protein (TIGR01451 family)
VPSVTLGVGLSGPPTAQAGSNITYSIMAGNEGPDAAQTFSLTDLLPSGVTFVSQAQNSGPTFTLSYSGGQVSDTIATLPAGASASFTLVASIPATTPNNTSLVDHAAVTTTTAISGDSVTNATATTNVTAPGGNPTFAWATHPAPALTNPGNRTDAEGSAVSVQLVASDSDGAPLTYAAVNLPAGLTLNPGTGLVSGTIAYGAAADFGGIYIVTVLVGDGEGGIASQTFTWTVTFTPQTPTLTNPGNQSNTEGDTVSLQVHASDPDGAAISYIDDGLPPGLTINSDTGLISGTISPTAALASPYTATITATGDGLDASVTFSWAVSATHFAPSVTSPGDQTSTAGDTVSLAIDAGDADQDALTYAVTGLPPGLSINGSTGVIGGTITGSAASSTPYTVTVTAYDGPQSAAQTFSWTVNSLGLANPGDQASHDGDNVVLPVVGSAPPGVTLNYSAAGLPSGLVISGATGVISGMIASNADTGGPYLATVYVTDGTNWANQSFAWTVSRTGDAAPSLTALGNQSSAEGATVSVQVTAADPNGDPIAYDATGLPNGLSIDAWTGLISGTIADGAAVNSPYNITVTADDQNGGVASTTFPWTVAAASLSAHGASFSAQEGVPNNEVTVATFTDPDPQATPGTFTAAITWGDGGTSMGTVTQAADGSFAVTGDHTYTSPGTFPMQVSIADGDGNVTTVSGTQAVSAAALTATGGQSLTAAAGSSVTPALGTVQAGNPDDPASSYTVSINWGDGGAPSAGSLNGTGGTFSVSGGHQYAADGLYSVVVTVTNKDGTTATLTDAVTVGNLYKGVHSTMTVAGLTLPDTSVTPAGLSATIQWGDGTQTTVSGAPGITGGSGTFSVTAPHTYAAVGNFSVTVTLTETSNGSQVSTSNPVSVVAAPVTLYGNDVAETAGQSFSGAVAAVYADPDTTDTGGSYQDSIGWGGGVGSTAGTVSALGNGLYQVVGGVVESAAGLYATGVKLLASNLAPVALAFLPGENEARGTTQYLDLRGPGVVAGGGTVHFRRLVRPDAGAEHRYEPGQVGVDNWTRVGGQFSLLGPVDGVRLVSANLVNQNGDSNRTIGYLATFDFPNKPVDAWRDLRGLVINGQEMDANKRLFIVEVDANPGFEVYKQDGTQGTPPRNNFKQTIGPIQPGEEDSVLLNTRGPVKYDLADLANRNAYKAELQKGLIGIADEVNVIGVGIDGMLGVSHIQLGWVQDIKSTFLVSYCTF